MPERVLNTDLSGLEVRKAIIDKIALALSRDCYLNEDTAYQYFECKINISLKCRDVGRVAPVEVNETVAGGVLGENEDQFLEVTEAHLELESTNANETRIETSQEVPVLTTGADGKKEIKGIRYPKKAARQVAGR